MSRKQIRLAGLLAEAIKGKYTVRCISEKTGLSERRIKQLKKAYRLTKETALIHGNTGRSPANKIDEVMRNKIISLKKKHPYDGYNMSHFREALGEFENIEIGYTTLYRMLKEAGIRSTKAHKKAKKKFTRRKRRSYFGELLQVDATSYDWFGTGVYYALHGFIDDATGNIIALYFCQNECLAGYLECIRMTIEKYGIPMELYSDKAGIFFVNNKKQEYWTAEEVYSGKIASKTQFGKIADELGIAMIAANSSQAKGRIERLWGTLQDRMSNEFKLFGIRTMQKANEGIQEFIERHNKKFAVKSEKEESSFVPMANKKDLDTILAVKHERKTDACGCFSFHNYPFQILLDKIIAKKKILFLFNEKIGFKAKLEGVYYDVECLLSAQEIDSHMPKVTKGLLEKYFLSDTKNDGSQGAIFACNF